ncbi:uncharacterized protein [Lepeophtheirus salmonis]|uniref:uncharacterized protein n=1 Tax=Lepeophtheirus salmonis TaxID=72036 RepID=UPI003AF3C34B
MEESFPFVFTALKSDKPLLKDFKGYKEVLYKSNPGGWVVRHDYGELYAKEIYNMELRDDDVWVVTFPKSGTTWMQSILWLLLNDGKFPINRHMDEVSPHLELDQGTPKDEQRRRLMEKKEELPKEDPFIEFIDKFIEKQNSTPVDLANSLPRNKRRLIKSHLPFCLLPPGVLKRNKVVFVYRDPRDVVISYYHHMRLISDSSFSGSLEDFFDYFIKDEVNCAPFWDYIHQAFTEGSKYKNKIHFVHFKDMKKDLRSVIEELIPFLDLNPENYDLNKIMEQVSIESMKKNATVEHSDTMVRLGLYNEDSGTFIRTGKSGGWKESFTPSMMKRMDLWTAEKTNGFRDLAMNKLYPIYKKLLTTLIMSLRKKFIPFKGTNNSLKDDFPGFQGDLEKCKDGDWVLFPRYGENYADEIYNMELRNDDIWITTYPKSGTTWMQSIVWLLLNDLQFDESKHMDDFSPHVDLDQVLQKEKFVPMLESKLKTLNHGEEHLKKLIQDRIDFLEGGQLEIANEIPMGSRRLLKSHLPFSLMPPGVLKKNKVIFVARDPRDVVLSYFRHQRLMKYYDFQGDFTTFLDYFVRDEIVGGPFWEFIHQGWEHKDKDNFLFVFFSDMKTDLYGTIQKLIKFLDLTGKYTESDIHKLMDMVSLQSCKNNTVMDGTAIKVQLGLYNDNRGGFVGEGKVGGWKGVFTPDMVAKMDEWTICKTQGRDLPLHKLYC